MVLTVGAGDRICCQFYIKVPMSFNILNAIEFFMGFAHIMPVTAHMGTWQPVAGLALKQP